MLLPVGFTALKETSCPYDAGSFDSTEAFYILGIKWDNWLVKKPSLQKKISCDAAQNMQYCILYHVLIFFVTETNDNNIHKWQRLIIYKCN